jgi:AraC-like DNA-binding protein
LQGYQEVVEELGLDARALVREAGLPPECLSEPDIKISSDAAFALLESTARRFGIADLGLRMAEKRRFSTLGAIGLVMREQPNVARALHMLTDHIWAHVEGLSMAFETSDDLVILLPAIEHAQDAEVRQAMELSVAVVANLLHRFLGADWRPEMVCFSHSRTTGLGRFVRTFGQAPVFDQERTMLVVKADDLAAEITGADPILAHELERYLEFVEGERPTDFAAHVRILIHQMLPRGDCFAVGVSQHLGINRRTLHRKLAAQGSTFERMVQQVRIELAVRYIGSEGRSLTEAAQLLGFAHLSGFSRWRRRWLSTDLAVPVRPVDAASVPQV